MILRAQENIGGLWFQKLPALLRHAVGTYSDIGSTTCGGYPSFNVSGTPDAVADAQLKRDVEALASWGVDSL